MPVTRTDNHTLLDGFHSRERWAYDQLYDYLFPRAVINSYRYLGETEDARDVALEALSQLFLEQRAFESLEHLWHWFWKVVRNKSLNALKERGRRTRRHERLADWNGQEAEEREYFADEVELALLRLLREQLAALPEKSQQVIRLLYIDGRKYREAADELGMTQKNLENLRAYALKKLRTACVTTDKP